MVLLQQTGWLHEFSFAYFFWAWWKDVFAGVFCENVRAERGFFVVNLWWIAGKSWWVDGGFLASENFPLF
jgi:hypothetical protein